MVMIFWSEWNKNKKNFKGRKRRFGRYHLGRDYRDAEEDRATHQETALMCVCPTHALRWVQTPPGNQATGRQEQSPLYLYRHANEAFLKNSRLIIKFAYQKDDSDLRHSV